jgi:RNA polymerase sigma factor (sigma-70 family)
MAFTKAEAGDPAFANQKMEQQELIPHLFRTEYRKITAVLCKLFGLEHLQVAEDIASDTFLQAMETWAYQGLPAQPTAWLYTVAKNKARNYFARDAVFTQKIIKHLQEELPDTTAIDVNLSDEHINDSQLQMLFALCHPAIPVAAQVALALRVLCGFGINEIADAFLTNKDTINKRIFRAKEKLRLAQVVIAYPSATEVEERLETVLRTIYLLFSEGYYSESREPVLREDLCLEAMRLTQLLLNYTPAQQPAVNALLALMCFHASRFEARKKLGGEMIFYQDQDEHLWNQALISKGLFFLNQSAQGHRLTKYHLEASIAYWQTVKEDSIQKWEAVLELYNQLLLMEYSPVVDLNRTYAVYKAVGRDAAINAAEQLPVIRNHYYYTLLGTLYSEKDPVKSREFFETALGLARTQTDRDRIKRNLS